MIADLATLGGEPLTLMQEYDASLAVDADSGTLSPTSQKERFGTPQVRLYLIRRTNQINNAVTRYSPN